MTVELWDSEEDEVLASCVLEALVPNANSYYGPLDDLKFEQVCAANEEFTWEKGDGTRSVECTAENRPSQRLLM